jgi:hypothetical protein
MAALKLSVLGSPAGWQPLLDPSPQELGRQLGAEEALQVGAQVFMGTADLGTLGR